MHTTGCLLILKLLQPNTLQAISWKKLSLDVWSQNYIGFSSLIISKNRFIFLVQYPWICWNNHWARAQHFLEDLWSRIPFQCCERTWSFPVSPSVIMHPDVHWHKPLKIPHLSQKRFQDVALPTFQHEVTRKVYFVVFRDFGAYLVI